MKKIANIIYVVYYISLYILVFGYFIYFVLAIFFDVGFGMEYEYNLNNIVWIENISYYVFLWYIVGATLFVIYGIIREFLN